MHGTQEEYRHCIPSEGRCGMSEVATRPTLTALYAQLGRAQEAYCNGAPPYTIERMRSLIAQMREWLGRVEHDLDECEREDAKRQEGEMSHFD